MEAGLYPLMFEGKYDFAVSIKLSNNISLKEFLIQIVKSHLPFCLPFCLIFCNILLLLSYCRVAFF